MIFSPYDNASSGDESIGLLVFAISLFPIILPSATIQPFNVGYQNLDSNASGATMMAPTFLNVNFADKCTLADLSVTGYSAPVYDEKRDRWSGGTKGVFNLQFLTSQGKTEATYLWYDDGTRLGWYDETGTTKVDGTKVDVPAGKGLWCFGGGLTLVVPAPEL